MPQHWLHTFQGVCIATYARAPEEHATSLSSHAYLQALLNSSQKYHDAMDNFKEYGVEVSNVKMVLPQMMKQKDKAVEGLTSGIEGLFKKNKVNGLLLGQVQRHAAWC